VGCCVAGRWWIGGCRGCVFVAAAQVPASIRMGTRARRSHAIEQRVRGARLRAGLTGRMGRSGPFPGIASRAGGAGLTGRNRKVCSVDRKSTFRERRFRMQDGIASAGAALIRVCRSAGSAWTQCYRGINSPTRVVVAEFRRGVEVHGTVTQIPSRRTAVRGQSATANAPVKVPGSQHARLCTACITASENCAQSCSRRAQNVL
jgi:hypothetical protein